MTIQQRFQLRRSRVFKTGAGSAYLDIKNDWLVVDDTFFEVLDCRGFF